MCQSTVVSISDRAEAVRALIEEQATIEADQLEVAAKMNVLMLKQLQLARRSGIILDSLKKFMCQGDVDG